MQKASDDQYREGYIAGYRAGIRDAVSGKTAALDRHNITVMRNMGIKTASEIAHWLSDHGIWYSAWNDYL